MFTCRSLCSFLSLLLLPFFCGLVNPRAYNATAGLSTVWIANRLDWGFPLLPILLRGLNGSGMAFICGFYYVANPKVCYFGIFIASTDKNSEIVKLVDPAVVWSPNRNNPVGANAKLELTAEGDLVLTDVDGSMAWSTNTTGMSVPGRSLMDTGNLVLFDQNNATVWQSFDHPTDSLVPGQKLKVGQKLTSTTSLTNWTEQSVLSLSLTPSGLFAQTETDLPQVHYSVWIDFPDASEGSNYIEFIEGALALFRNSVRNGSVLSPFNSLAQYIKFEADGLRSHHWDGLDWIVSDLLRPDAGDCGYPMVCGKYGICNSDGQCSCPTSSGGKSYFKPVNDRDPKLGYVETAPLSCEASQFQTFLELNDIVYFTYNSDPQLTPDLANIEKESCRKA